MPYSEQLTEFFLEMLTIIKEVKALVVRQYSNKKKDKNSIINQQREL